jgi:hypothetical protein
MTRRTKPPHAPTDAQRQTVQLHTTVGTPQPVLARLLSIDEKTLRKYYRDELDLAKAKANATIGGALFNKAKGGDTTAMIFWMKTQAGWKETSIVEGSGPNGEHLHKVSIDATRLSDTALDELIEAMNGIDAS